MYVQREDCAKGWLRPLCLVLSLAASIPSLASAATIAVDIGHSPDRPGAMSARGRPEFDFNRDLARVAAAALERVGFRVRLINELGDIGGLEARPAAATGADFFLSLHHDAVQPQYLDTWEVEGVRRSYCDRFSGFSLFVSRSNPELAKSQACASALGAALRGAGWAPSLYHAEPIPGENRPFADAENGVHYFDDLVVLKRATMPAVLLEAGVIVNRQEELMLADTVVRNKIATAIAEGLAHCLGPTTGSTHPNAP